MPAGTCEAAVCFIAPNLQHVLSEAAVCQPAPLSNRLSEFRFHAFHEPYAPHFKGLVTNISFQSLLTVCLWVEVFLDVCM